MAMVERASTDSSGIDKIDYVMKEMITKGK